MQLLDFHIEVISQASEKQRLIILRCSAHELTSLVKKIIELWSEDQLAVDLPRVYYCSWIRTSLLNDFTLQNSEEAVGVIIFINSKKSFLFQKNCVAILLQNMGLFGTRSYLKNPYAPFLTKREYHRYSN